LSVITGDRSEARTACAASVLIVAQDPAQGHALRTACERVARAQWHGDHEGGTRALCEGPRVAAVLASARPSSEHAIELARLARARFGCPTLVIGARSSHDLVHAAFDAGASFLSEPFSLEQIERFVQRATRQHASTGAGERDAARSLAARVALTPRELQIVELAVSGMRRRDMREALGVTESTLKWHIRALLHKCGATNLTELARLALRPESSGAV